MRKNEKARYTSLSDLRKASNLKPIKKQTSDEKKLEKQREKFANSHICPICKKAMDLIPGTNIMCCTNPKCDSNSDKPVLAETENGDQRRVNIQYHVLDKKGAEIANNIFTED